MSKAPIVSGTPDQAEKTLKQGEKSPKRATFKPKRASAGPCSRTPSHVNTRIYKTSGSTRYCVCDDCGETWKLTGQPADDLALYAIRIAESLDQAERVETDDGLVIVIDDAMAKEMAADLRRLSAS